MYVESKYALAYQCLTSVIDPNQHGFDSCCECFPIAITSGYVRQFRALQHCDRAYLAAITASIQIQQAAEQGIVNSGRRGDVANMVPAALITQHLSVQVPSLRKDTILSTLEPFFIVPKRPNHRKSRSTDRGLAYRRNKTTALCFNHGIVPEFKVF